MGNKGRKKSIIFSASPNQQTKEKHWVSFSLFHNLLPLQATFSPNISLQDGSNVPEKKVSQRDKITKGKKICLFGDPAANERQFLLERRKKLSMIRTGYSIPVEVQKRGEVKFVPKKRGKKTSLVRGINWREGTQKAQKSDTRLASQSEFGL